MKAMHMVLVAAALSSAALVGCGGGAPSPDSPTDAMPDDATDGMSTDDMGGDDVAAPAPSDGIIRDADGDGQPDDANVGCDGLSQTKCQITAGCAWSGDEKCVEASGDGM